MSDPATTGESAELGEELLRLASADNFRDVTGVDSPYRAADGSALRRGVVYRSNELQLTEADAASLSRLGVTRVVDLRHPREVAAHPDVAVPGATWTHLEVRGIPTDELGELTSRTDGDEVMRRVYRGFVDRAGARDAFGRLFRLIADSANDGALVFHCTAGKDRTGWASALLLHLAGVDDAVVTEDYLLTNTFSTRTREKYLAKVREHLGEDKVEVYERVLVADEGYLQAAYDAVEVAYGSREAYLRDGLGLDRRVLDRLRDRLRV